MHRDGDRFVNMHCSPLSDARDAQDRELSLRDRIARCNGRPLCIEVVGALTALSEQKSAILATDGTALQYSSVFRYLKANDTDSYERICNFNGYRLFVGGGEKVRTMWDWMRHIIDDCNDDEVRTMRMVIQVVVTMPVRDQFPKLYMPACGNNDKWHAGFCPVMHIQCFDGTCRGQLRALGDAFAMDLHPAMEMRHGALEHPMLGAPYNLDWKLNFHMVHELKASLAAVVEGPCVHYSDNRKWVELVAVIQYSRYLSAIPLDMWPHLIVGHCSDPFHNTGLAQPFQAKLHLWRSGSGVDDLWLTQDHDAGYIDAVRWLTSGP